MAKSKSEQALKRWQRNYLPHIIGIGESLHSAERVSGTAWKFAMSAVVEAMRGKANLELARTKYVMLEDLIEYVEGEDNGKK